MKTKIGIITIIDYSNYGNRLQNYALTKLLEKYAKVKTLSFTYTKEQWINETDGFIKKFLKQLTPFNCFKNRIINVVISDDYLIESRKVKFQRFTNKYIKVLKPIIKKKEKDINSELVSNIDFFITGSDQVWNPYFAGLDYYFLTFIPKEKRLSFAASIGLDTLPENCVDRYKNNLNNMKYLSVREQSAADLIKNLTGKDADVTLDPTLLLEKQEWDKILTKPDIELPQDYICTYFLGEEPEAVSIFAKEKNLKVFRLNNRDYEDLFILDPSEFLYMINKASYVLTDSFHAVAFSIKFNKEFYVFDRKQQGVQNMFSRIENITSKLKLDNRIQERNQIIEQSKIDSWNDINEYLLHEKDKSLNKLFEKMGLSYGKD